jgi:Raf kinase inhibitor-like YbhB/YbcL family protein
VNEIKFPANLKGEKSKMRFTQILTTCAILAISITGSLPAGAQAPPAAAPAVPGLTLTSPAFEDGSVIPAKFTQSVTDFVSPKLAWTNVPPNTVSFVLIAHDPDVAIDKKIGDVLHWMAFNIPGTATGLPEAVPANAMMSDGTVQAKNRRGAVGYLGPGAPAVGPYHHYTFELFALDTKLSLGADATRADVIAAMDGHILGKGVLVGRFHR